MSKRCLNLGLLSKSYFKSLDCKDFNCPFPSLKNTIYKIERLRRQGSNRQIQRSFQYDYIDKGIVFKNDREVYEILHNIYNRFLKETRRQICKFFNIRDTKELDVKLMLRIYYYYLPKDDPDRIMMDYLNFQVSHIIDRISIGYKFIIFLSDDHPFNYKEPIDVS